MENLRKLRSKISLKWSTMFHVALVYKSAWIGILLHEIFQLLHSVSDAQQGLTAEIADVMGKRVGSQFVEFEAAAAIGVFLMHIVSVYCFSTGYDRQHSKRLLASFIWTVSFYMIIMPIYIIFVMVYLNRMPSPSSDDVFINHEDIHEYQVAAQAKAANLRMYNFFASLTLLTELFMGAFCCYALFKFYVTAETRSMRLQSQTETTVPEPKESGYSVFA